MPNISANIVVCFFCLTKTLTCIALELSALTVKSLAACLPLDRRSLVAVADIAEAAASDIRGLLAALTQHIKTGKCLAFLPVEYPACVQVAGELGLVGNGPVALPLAVCRALRAENSFGLRPC